MFCFFFVFHPKKNSKIILSKCPKPFLVCNNLVHLEYGGGASLIKDKENPDGNSGPPT